MIFTDTKQLNKQAYNALKRIRENKTKLEENALVEENAKYPAKAKYNLLFSEFDDKKFKEKVKLDSFIYNVLLDNISEADKESVTTIIAEMMTTVKGVYEFINIEPRVVGFKNMTSNNNYSSLMTEAANVINKFIDSEYYSLTTEEKQNKYKNQVINLSRNIVIEENVDAEEAVVHSYKAIIIENLIHEINFPYIIKHKIKEIFEDSMYNDFFDINQLSDLMESFELKAKNVARIVSVLIK